MPGAGDNPGFQISAGKRSAHVRTKIVDGGVLVPLVENGDHAAVDGEGLALTIGDIADFGDGDKIRHMVRRKCKLEQDSIMKRSTKTIKGGRQRQRGKNGMPGQSNVSLADLQALI